MYPWAASFTGLGHRCPPPCDAGSLWASHFLWVVLGFPCDCGPDRRASASCRPGYAPFRVGGPEEGCILHTCPRPSCWSLPTGPLGSESGLRGRRARGGMRVSPAGHWLPDTGCGPRAGTAVELEAGQGGAEAMAPFAPRPAGAPPDWLLSLGTYGTPRTWVISSMKRGRWLWPQVGVLTRTHLPCLSWAQGLAVQRPAGAQEEGTRRGLERPGTRPPPPEQMSTLRGGPGWGDWPLLPKVPWPPRAELDLTPAPS